MPHDRLVIVNPAGDIASIVIWSDDEAAPDYGNFAYNLPGHVPIRIDAATYDALPKALNFNGKALDHDLNKAIVAAVTASDAKLGGILAAKIAAEDARELAAKAELAVGV